MSRDQKYTNQFGCSLRPTECRCSAVTLSHLTQSACAPRFLPVRDVAVAVVTQPGNSRGDAANCRYSGLLGWTVWADLPLQSRSVLNWFTGIVWNFVYCTVSAFWWSINPLTAKDHYRSRTAPLISKCCILYMNRTYISTEYFKYGLFSPSFKNIICFVSLKYLVPVLFTLYIQGVLKLKQ